MNFQQIATEIKDMKIKFLTESAVINAHRGVPEHINLRQMAVLAKQENVLNTEEMNNGVKEISDTYKMLAGRVGLPKMEASEIVVNREKLSETIQRLTLEKNKLEEEIMSDILKASKMEDKAINNTEAATEQVEFKVINKQNQGQTI
ncbi:MAG TPA: hypothetical protein VGQ59_05580 [Cyclobacteriaceae bacterium]|jgi:hypothetical protein|nr:hypothetical protein [Cyclobacteriaceae bacterium]